MRDRRARLRPRDGARELYYGSAGLAQTQGTNLFDERLPWYSSKPFAEQAPNAPQFLSGNVSVGRSTRNSNSKGIADSINILSPLALTGGLVWPYTPTINFSQTVDYTSFDPVHTNQEIYSYVRTKAPMLTVAGNFAVQNQTDAAYALAAIHFLRTIVKMSFGNSQNPGTPPPIMIFSSYGEYMFNDVPVIIQAFTVDFDSQVDYIQVPNTDTVVPSMFLLNVSLVVQNTPDRLRQFNLEKFRSGQLLKQKGWL